MMMKLALKHFIYDACIAKIFDRICDNFHRSPQMPYHVIESMLDACIITGFMPTSISAKSQVFMNIHSMKRLHSQLVLFTYDGNTIKGLSIRPNLIMMHDIICVRY